MVIFLQNSPSPSKNELFILDSNIWLPILGYDNSISDHYKIYFDKIIKSDSCKILISPLQISEIFNRWLRFHGFKYYNKNGNSGDFRNYYKDTYRRSTDFKNKFGLIRDELENYIDKIQISELQELNYGLITNFKEDELDINDNYLYLMAKQYDATFITDDGDFKSLDIKIATFNKSIYSAYKSSIRPKI